MMAHFLIPVTRKTMTTASPPYWPQFPQKYRVLRNKKTPKSTENNPIENYNTSVSDKPVTPPTPFSAILSTPKRKRPQRITFKALTTRHKKLRPHCFQMQSQ